jgi:hypothetical protein
MGWAKVRVEKKNDKKRQTHLGFLKAGVHAWFEVSEVTKDTLFEFFHISHRATKSLCE